MERIHSQRGYASQISCKVRWGYLLTFLAVAPALAAPEGGSVVAGSAQINQTIAQRTNVVQQSERAVIDWRGFSIDSNEHVNFQQPSPQSSTLNRVTGPEISQILGRLTANGNVFLVNPHGIVFGKDAKVDVAGLVASTANIANADFMAGSYQFDQVTNRTGRIINRGEINAAEGGLVALVAPGVENSGVIHARLGKVALASGNAFTLDLYGDQLVTLAVNDPVIARLTDAQGQPLQALVNQTGEIAADGGSVWLTANTAKDIVDNVINMSGVIKANTAALQNGEIVLNGGESGTVQVSGVLDASGREAGQSGGSVRVLGDQVTLASGTSIDVAGISGGGTALIGGDFQGQGAIPTASRTVVAAGTTIAADALTSGDGGRVIVWSDGVTDFHGRISARGGNASGDGGFVEVSGKEKISFDGDVSLTAPAGRPGKLLIDPANLTVGQDIPAATIASILQSGASASFTADQNITINERIEGRGGSAGGKLSFTAGQDVLINNDILTNNGAVAITANSGSIAMGAGPADSVTGGKGAVIFAGSAPITLSAAQGVEVQHLLTSGVASIESRTGSVTLLQNLGGAAGDGQELGQLSISAVAGNALLKQLRTRGSINIAANDSTVDGQIISGGPVTFSGANVTLKRSIFTNNAKIEFGGNVILDPAGNDPALDEVISATALDALTRKELLPTSTDALTTGSADFPSFRTPTAEVVLTTRQISLDTGLLGADIVFRGQVDIAQELRDPRVMVFGKDDAFNLDRTTVPPKPLVALFLSAGNGNINFMRGIEGIGQRVGDANGVKEGRIKEDAANFQGKTDQDGFTSTNTISLRIGSGMKLVAGNEGADDFKLFVNNFEKSVTTQVEGNAVQQIFGRFINVEEGEDGTQPPIFPEPGALPGRGVAFGGGLTIGLPSAPLLPGSGSDGAGSLNAAIAQAEQPEREVSDPDSEESQKGECRGLDQRDCRLVVVAPGSGEEYENNEYLRPSH